MIDKLNVEIVEGIARIYINDKFISSADPMYRLEYNAIEDFSGTFQIILNAKGKVMLTLEDIELLNEIFGGRKS